jgi:transcription termination factor Rho
LIDAILERQGGGSDGADDSDEELPYVDADAGSPESYDRDSSADPDDRESSAEPGDRDSSPETYDRDDEDDEDRPPSRRRRGRRGGRGRSATASDSEPAPETAPADALEAGDEAPEEDELVAGVVELLPGGSGFVRVNPPDASDDDVYISAAQVKRCDLVSGDQVSGPRRAPRRSERFASLLRIDTINGRPADEVADSGRFDELPAAFPDQRFRLGSEDPTLKAIEWLTPFGKGSRVTITGAPRAGKTEALRRLAAALAGLEEELSLFVALAGVRPEEIAEWSSGPAQVAAAVSVVGSPDAQGQAVERVIDQARRLAARGGDAVVLVDTIDGMHPHIARKVLAAARNIVDGGSLTVVATSSAPAGAETTVIALDVALTRLGRFPAVDLLLSGTLRPELLVGEVGADAITRARVEAAEA